MMVYDYKFPTLAKNLFYQYCKNKRYGHLPENCAFNIVNFTDVEYSNRINPIQRKYIPLYDMGDLGDRIGAAVRYNVNPSFSIGVSFEHSTHPNRILFHEPNPPMPKEQK